MVWDVRRDEVELGDGQTVTREVIAHTGAVGVIALDEQDRVLLLRQYRHPVRSYLWEPPAGLLDVPGEDPLAAARRELAEEADLTRRRSGTCSSTSTTRRGQHRGVPLLPRPGAARGARGETARR